jgi:hypothetical protein
LRRVVRFSPCGGAAIFFVAFVGAIDRDHDEGFDFLFGDEAISGFVEVPWSPTEGGARAGGGEGVLTVVDIEDGVAAFGFGIVGGRNVDVDAARFA